MKFLLGYLVGERREVYWAEFSRWEGNEQTFDWWGNSPFLFSRGEIPGKVFSNSVGTDAKKIE